MRLRLVTAPTVEPLTAVEARARAGISDDVAEATVNAWVKASRQGFDGKDGLLGRALVQQTWELSLEDFLSVDCQPPFPRPWFWTGPSATSRLKMPLPPLISVTSVKFLDVDSAEQTLATDQYRVIPGDPGFVVAAAGLSWPAVRRGEPDAVKITFICGYGGDGSAVPEPIREAIARGLMLANSSTSRDPLLAREVVEGVGEFAYSGGVQSASMINTEAMRLVAPYRVGGGIS